jgi:hypothetical protein
VVAAPARAVPEGSKLTGESPLAQVPAKSPIVVSMHGFQRTTKRLITMVTNAMPDLGPKLEKEMEDALKKDFFENRKLTGLKDDGHIFLVFPDMPKVKEEIPNLALIVRVTDYKAFRDGFLTEDERKALKADKAGYEVTTVSEKEIYFVKRKDYAVVSADKDVALLFAGKDKWKGLDSTLAKGVGNRLLDADLAAYVDLTAINKEYGEKLRSLRKDMEDALERLPDLGITTIDKKQIELIKILAGGLLQIFDDSQNTLLTIEFRSQGLAVHTELNVKANTKSNKVLKAMKPSPLAGLKSLPSTYMSYIAADFGADALKALQPVMKGFLASADEEEDKDQAKAIQEAVNELFAAKPRSLESASTLGTGGDSLQIWQYGDPAKAVAAQLKLFKALKPGGKFQFTPLKDKPTIKADAQKFRGAKLHYVSLKWDLEKLTGNIPFGGDEVAEAMKKLTGEGLDLWFGVVDKQYVQVAAKDWATAEKHLNEYFTKKKLIGEEKNKAFAKARGQLPKEATALNMTHVPSYAEFWAQYLYSFLKIISGLNVNEPGKASKRASYFGMALTLKGGQGSFDLWIPGDAAKEFRRVFEPMFKQADD